MFMEFGDDSDTYETDSDELDEEIENELYSVLHYNVLSEDIPSSLLDKYDIKKTEQNEFLISLKKSKQESFEEGNKETSDKDIALDLNDDNFAEPTLSFITISDDDSDSVVILNEPELEVTYVSSPSVVEVSDSSSVSDMGDDMILNIGGKTTLSSIFPVDDSEEEVVKVKWKEVTSPCTWTDSMKKYYNKPCERLKNFDYEKIRAELKGHGDWHINLSDSLPTHRKVKRCTICRQTDHQRKNCPRRFVNCHMCGNAGHNESNCPSKKCLNCGRKNRVYVAMCQRCEETRFQVCSECKQKGHTKDICPDTWRRYHATTKGELVVKEETANPRLMCCNCAQSGHLFENCPKLYWSVYPPTSSLIKNTEELAHKSPKGKRLRGEQEGSTDFVRTPKKRKMDKKYCEMSLNEPSWNRGPFNKNSSHYMDQTPSRFDHQRHAPFDRSPAPFGRNPAPFNQNPSPFGRNPAPFNQNPSLFGRNPAPFNQNPSPFDRNPAPFNQNPSPFGRNPAPFNQNPSPFGNRTSTPFDERSTPFNQRPTPFNQRKTPFNQRSTPFSQRSPFRKTSTPFSQKSPLRKKSTPFNQASTPINQKCTPFNQNSSPFNEASTSSKRSEPTTPKRNKKIRYFHNNSINNNINTNKSSPNQIKSPKQKKKKKKKKNSPQ